MNKRSCLNILFNNKQYRVTTGCYIKMNKCCLVLLILLALLMLIWLRPRSRKLSSGMCSLKIKEVKITIVVLELIFCYECNEESNVMPGERDIEFRGASNII